MSMANPQDVPGEDVYVYGFAEMIKNTNKPVVFIAENGIDLAKMYDIACLVAGGEEELESKPFLLHYAEGISPLHFPHNVMERLMFCAEKTDSFLLSFRLKCRRRRARDAGRRHGIRYC